MEGSPRYRGGKVVQFAQVRLVYNSIVYLDERVKPHPGHVNIYSMYDFWGQSLPCLRRSAI